ncbi:hypothetical protein AA313_de0207715 [Arthrobotrys entomopaga]|nr:hypothetical protein AA313_de0207715 [Arthrobotrys entomopaga]
MDSSISLEHPTRCSVDDLSFPSVPSRMFYKPHACEDDLRPNSHQATIALRSAVYVAEIKLTTYRQHIINLDQKVESLENSLAEIKARTRSNEERRQRLVEKLRAAVLRNQELIQQIQASQEKNAALEKKIDDLLEKNSQSYRPIQENRPAAGYLERVDAKAQARAKAERDPQLLKDLNERIEDAETALNFSKQFDDTLKLVVKLNRAEADKTQDSNIKITKETVVYTDTAKNKPTSASTQSRSSFAKSNNENDGWDDLDDEIEISVE